ncbi:MAG TPA: hypothetical protein VGC09_14240 [Rhodopila sp.]
MPPAVTLPAVTLPAVALPVVALPVVALPVVLLPVVPPVVVPAALWRWAPFRAAVNKPSNRLASAMAGSGALRSRRRILLASEPGRSHNRRRERPFCQDIKPCAVAC